MLELLVIGLVGWMAWALRDVRARARLLETRLNGLEAMLATLPPGVRPTTDRAVAPDAEFVPLPVAAPAEATFTPDDIASPPPFRGAMPSVSPPLPPAATGATASGPSLEERLGTRWTVWAGGAALAAGALLLVKYSIDQGVFGPGVRVLLGLLLAGVLVGLGEMMRRSAFQLPIDALPTAHIPSVLTAAGTVAAFASLYAAHGLYGFIGPALAFLLLGAVGVATMAAAALHGPALAGLGLVGALVTPALVSSPNPNLWPVVLYLAVVAAAAYALARLRRWLWLAQAVVAGVGLWGLLFALGGGGAVSALPILAHVVVQVALAAAFIAVEPHLTTRDADAVPDRVATSALAWLTLVAVVGLAATRTADAGWGLAITALMGVLLATGLRAPPAALATVCAGAVALAVAATWPDVRAAADTRFLWPAVADLVRVPERITTYLTMLAVLSFAVTAAGAYRLWHGPTLRPLIAGAYATAAVVTPLAVLICAYLRVTQFDRSIWFAGLAALLAAAFFFITTRFAAIATSAPEGNDEGADDTSAHRIALGAFAAGTMAALALAFTMSLDRGYLTVAFAATAAATAWIAHTTRIPLLRRAVAALGVIVLARVAIEPRIMGAAGIGTWPILNWLLLGYGAPALAFAAAGLWLKRTRVDLASQVCDALAVVFTALLGFYQIRHLLNGGDILTPATTHVEVGLSALLSILLAYALNRIELRRRNPVFAIAVMVFGVIAAIGTFTGLLALQNPLFTNERVFGPPVASSLMLAYLVPGLAAVVFARFARANGQTLYMTLGAILAIVLIFAYTTLETRHIFQGENIGIWRSTGSAEMWAYSAVWLALGLILLGYGVVRGSFEARVASGVLVLMATLKTFVFDLAGLTGIWRPLSFLVLGAVLIGIGLVYQRLVFGRPASAAATPTAGGT